MSVIDAVKTKAPDSMSRPNIQRQRVFTRVIRQRCVKGCIEYGEMRNVRQSRPREVDSCKGGWIVERRQRIQLLDLTKHGIVQSRRGAKLLATVHDAMDYSFGRRGWIEASISGQQLVDRGLQIRAYVLDMNFLQAPPVRRVDQGAFD